MVWVSYLCRPFRKSQLKHLVGGNLSQKKWRCASKSIMNSVWDSNLKFFDFQFRICGRHGLQCVTLCVFLTFFLGLFYRSAALYHPQRRAILHLKTQRRKVKEKNRQNNRIAFFDLKTLRSQTVRIILLSSACSAFGLYIPIIQLAQTVQNDKMLLNAELTLQTNMGIAWIFGAFVFGVLVIRNNADCRIARQYLCQVSLFMCSICLLALTKIQANYEGYFIIVWTYGTIWFSHFSFIFMVVFA